MSKVYFIEQKNANYNELGKSALGLLKTIEAETNHQFAEKLPIKVHFGEKGNNTYMPPECYDAVIEYLKSKNVSPTYIETNVLYRGARTTAESHRKLALEHGFNQIPIIFADGEIGTDYNEIEINKDYIDKCKIGKAYQDYKQYIVMSHFKGHNAAGFGGALKQLAMGFAARGGKFAQHSGISPIVSAKKCIACGLCVEKCDFDAIHIDEVAVIDNEKCVGCAGCIAVCPEAAIRNDWGGSNFLEKLAEYAYGASRDKDIIYISFLQNITADCDCMGQHMDLIADNIGVLASKDPVALDCACLDMLQKNSAQKLFEKGRKSLQHAEKIGLGTTRYELISIK